MQSGKITNLVDIFWIFLKLGLTSFGGPIAHLGYFRQAFVSKHQWLTEQNYADLVALCQFLPGPASSQVGIAIGWYRGGLGGALAAWLGFTAPSALLLIWFALGLRHYPDIVPSGLIHGLKVLAVAVVFQAIWGMARNLAPDAPRVTVMVISAITVLLMPNTWVQIMVMIAAALFGLVYFKAEPQSADDKRIATQPRQRLGVICLSVFVLLLVTLPMLKTVIPSP